MTDFEFDVSDFCSFDEVDYIAEKEIGKREANPYDVNDETERKRIAFQRELNHDADVAILNNLIWGKDNPIILEIGCNTGELLVDRVASLACRNAQAFGVDIDPEIIATAKSYFPNYKWAVSNVESEDFVSEVAELLGQRKPDLIILSMVILHLKDPKSALARVKQLCKKGTKLFIRDMDDSLAVAFPDDDNILQRTLDISHRSRYTGNRHSGREIYYDLVVNGFSNIISEPVIVDTTCMTAEQRYYLFLINFGYIRGDVMLSAEDDPINFAIDADWYNQVGFPTLQMLFSHDDFYYRMGTVVFTAEM